MAGQAGGCRAGQDARPGRASAGSRNGRATMRRLPGIPDEYIGAGRRAARRSGAASSTPSPRLSPSRDRAALRLRRPPSARGRRHLPRARRDRRPALAAQPSAAAHRRGRLAAADRRHRAARANCSNWCCATSTARAGWSPRARCPAAAIAGSTEYLRAVCGVEAAGRALPPPLCRRCRPRARRPLVGARRPHAGAVGRGLCAGKPPGAVARLLRPLQVDECRARRAVLRGVPRQRCAPAPTATSRASAC